MSASYFILFFTLTNLKEQFFSSMKRHVGLRRLASMMNDAFVSLQDNSTPRCVFETNVELITLLT